VIEAESQAALNTLTEHDFQNAFEKCQKHWERCIRAEGDYFEGDVGLGSKLVLTRWQYQSRELWMVLCKLCMLSWFLSFDLLTGICRNRYARIVMVVIIVLKLQAGRYLIRSPMRLFLT
jgi:hypothetical protein